MKALLRLCGRRGRGVAAVEFAITLPVLLILLGGVTDFGMVYYNKSCLSTALEAGAQYANLTDQAGTTLTAAHMQTVMQNAAAQSMPHATVTPAAACYCITGTATTSWNTDNPVNCANSCATGSKYVQLTLTSNYNAILPFYSMMANTTTLSATIWIPLQ